MTQVKCSDCGADTQVTLLMQKFVATWNAVPVMVFAIIVPATLPIAINYLYLRPRYRLL